MEEEVFQEPTIVQRPVLPHRPYCRVCIDLEGCICALFSREDVPCAHVREIREDPHLFDIWCALPHDMMTLMHHVVDAMTLI